MKSSSSPPSPAVNTFPMISFETKADSDVKTFFS